MHKQVGRRPVALFAMAIDLVAYFCANMAAQTEHQPHWHGDLASSFAPSVCGYACLAGLLDGELSAQSLDNDDSSMRSTSPAAAASVFVWCACAPLLTDRLYVAIAFSLGGARSLIQVLQSATISTLFSKKDSEAAFAMQETWLSVSSILICCVLTQVIPTVHVDVAT